MNGPRGELWKIVASMTATCAIGAAILGGVYVGTERYAEEARMRGERRAVTELLGLDDGARVIEVGQYLTGARDAVVYRVPAADGAAGRELVFALDGALVRDGALADAAAAEVALRAYHPLGRLFIATRDGAAAGFVAEGESRGYKNRIRFFVALDAGWRIAGVRVVEHEEDPGLGAEVATGWFQGQYVGRELASVPALDVTRDPMPEDWRAALRARAGAKAGAGGDGDGSRIDALRAREGSKPIYAVTGATISSRALTDGVRATILHFRRRWDLIGPRLLPSNAAEVAR
ncbi:MAG TPA: FMN-binding protein [Candidatus Eisenbacteria bacterium]|nr:FMN-binding protein [Candidatus Eisenbacteria bacterium]